MRMNCIGLAMSLLTTMAACVRAQDIAGAPVFGDDLAFLQKRLEVIVLSDTTGAMQVAVVPAYQCRVMTSTAEGLNGISYGWVNRELIASGKFQPHINVFGGEDRFWIGPEGGQFSIFFANGVSFDLEHWFTPPPIDTEPFELIGKTRDRVHCRRRMRLTNYSGAAFELEVNREIHLLTRAAVAQHLGIVLQPEVKVVGFESFNTVKNTGDQAWQRETGLLSIWILGMFNASPATAVAIPFQPGPEAARGPVVNDAYFGKVPPGRLVVRDSVLFFAADARHRSKIGIPPQRCKPMLGSYDAVHRLLTLVQFTLPEGAVEYVNSMWKMQDDPWSGDVVNSYNDGPPAPGAAQMGQFYELETSSPALALACMASATHRHRTIHLQGSESDLEVIARKTLGVGIVEIQEGLKR